MRAQEAKNKSDRYHRNFNNYINMRKILIILMIRQTYLCDQRVTGFVKCRVVVRERVDGHEKHRHD